MGVENTKSAASSRYYWKRMAKEIEEMVIHGVVCIQNSQSNKSESLVEKEPSRNLDPGVEHHADFFSFDGDRYISIKDRFSGFLWMEKLKDIEET